jgi:hypothetical protein
VRVHASFALRRSSGSFRIVTAAREKAKVNFACGRKTYRAGTKQKFRHGGASTHQEKISLLGREFRDVCRIPIQAYIRRNWYNQRKIVIGRKALIFNNPLNIFLR